MLMGRLVGRELVRSDVVFGLRPVTRHSRNTVHQINLFKLLAPGRTEVPAALQFSMGPTGLDLEEGAAVSPRARAVTQTPADAAAEVHAIRVG
jgi:hypothetical protein